MKPFAPLSLVNIPQTIILLVRHFSWLINYMLRNDVITNNNNKSFKIRTFRTVFSQIAQFSIEICGFAIFQLIIKIYGFEVSGLAHVRNLRICDSGTSLRIRGFSI